MFACLYLPPSPLGTPAPARKEAREGLPPNEALLRVAREFSPRIEVHDAVVGYCSVAVSPSSTGSAVGQPRPATEAAGLGSARAQGREGLPPSMVTLDVSGLERLLGPPRAIGEELRRTAADQGLAVHVAVAATRVAAILLARVRAGLTVIPLGEEAAALAPLPLAVLAAFSAVEPNPRTPAPGSRTPMRSSRTPDPGSRIPICDPHPPVLATLKRWGLKTLGDLAALPPADLSERLGQEGLAWQRLARGDDPGPLVPSVPEERFEESLNLEWPIEELEPLSFVFGRLFEPLCARLERRDRGAAALHVRLRLVPHAPSFSRGEQYERRLQLPAPIRDPRVLRTLALLDLESHPPPAAIDAIAIAVDPTAGRVLQHSLLTRALPSPEQFSTLVARLGALMGDDRVGSPALVDTHRPGAFEMTPFLGVRDSGFGIREDFASSGLLRGKPESIRSSRTPDPESRIPIRALRRFRLPVPARVTVESNRPVRVLIGRRGLYGGRVEVSAGPWRSSGEWWKLAAGWGKAGDLSSRFGWNCDEWDVALGDGAQYRIYRDRERDRWFVDGVLD